VLTRLNPVGIETAAAGAPGLASDLQSQRHRTRICTHSVIRKLTDSRASSNAVFAVALPLFRAPP